MSDLIGEGFPLLFQLLAHPSLGDRIDQQGQGHYHQQALDARGLFHKEGGGEKEGLLEEAEAAFGAALAFVAG